MWFKIEDNRTSIAQAYSVRCTTEIGGQAVTEERAAKGVAAARKTAELLAASLNTTATVYGRDAQGEFVHGVFEFSERAAEATDPIIKRLYAESATASLALRDQLLADIPEETIKGFATLAASLGHMIAQHKQIKKPGTPQISYNTLFRILCGPEEANVLSLPAADATISLMTKRLLTMDGWMWLNELSGVGSPEKRAVVPNMQPRRSTLNIDGEVQVLRYRTVFRGTVPETGALFMLIAEASVPGYNLTLDSVGLVYNEVDEAAVIALTRRLLAEANPFKNRIVLLNRDLRTVRSKMSDRRWDDIVPHVRARQELDFIAQSIRARDMLKQEGLSIRRGLLLSGPPGDGKSTAIECFVNDIAGEATILIVEAVEHIRAVYHLAQTLAPAVVILEDLDLMTKARQNPYAHVAKDDVTGELLQVLSGGSAYGDIVTIATTNHPEAIDEALSKRAGRFDAHVRMGYPGDDEKRRILDLYLDRFSIGDALTRRKLHQVLTKDLGRLHLVPAHIEEFVKAGVKRARLAQRVPEYADFEPGIEATKSIASAKPAA